MWTSPTHSWCNMLEENIGDKKLSVEHTQSIFVLLGAYLHFSDPCVIEAKLILL